MLGDNRVTEQPEFFDPTDECPAGGGVAIMRAPGGHEMGTSRLCLESVEFTCERRCIQQETGTLANTLPRGQIFADVSFTYVFDASFSRAIHFAAGTVSGGTGVYSGSSGRLKGGGLIRFAPDFTAYPNLVYTLHFQLRTKAPRTLAHLERLRRGQPLGAGAPRRRLTPCRR